MATNTAVRTLDKYTNAQLVKAIGNPVTKAAALAEIERRHAVSIQVKQDEIAAARVVLEQFSFAALPVEVLATIVRLMKKDAPYLGIIGDTLPAEWTQVREAVKTVLDAEGIHPWSQN